MLNLINQFCESHKEQDKWENSSFYCIKKLTNDARGELGENLISKVFHFLHYSFQQDYSNNSVHTDGHYDLKIEQQRIEVKTTCADSNFQHEPLYKENVCDIVIFIDFTYDKYWISIVKNKDLPLGKDSEYFGRKHGTLRKNKDDGYKLDFSHATLTKLENKKMSKLFYPNDSIDKVADFIKEWWEQNV